MSKARIEKRNADSSSLPPLIDAMSRPEFYPHHPSEVELKQTHISYLFLAGEYVYKVKKSVRFNFLDYSTLERRRHFCREEVRLNRRLAPAVYLGVIPIVRKGAGFALQESGAPQQESSVAEYAVQMHRLPEERMLHSLLAEGKVGEGDVRAIAAKLAAFHRNASAEQAPVYGSPDAIRRRVAGNLQETETFIDQTIGEKELAEIQEYNRRFLEENQDLLKRRVQEGRIREGHGDLRSEHICLSDEIVVFDCIEFSEEFRTCDVASEIGFLAMDLDFLGTPLYSQELIDAYGEEAGDGELPLLLPFYKCYRACVRGKVESLKSVEGEVPEAERNRAREQARRYFRLSHGYTKTPQPPALVAVCGMAASGKSTIARRLGERTAFQVIRSDVLRKQLARVPPDRRMTLEYRAALYNDESTRLTYRALLAEAERCLKAGKGVIVDATFKDPEHRRWFLDLAYVLKVPVLFLECRASEEEILRRLKERERKPDEVSDATWEIYLRQKEEFTPLNEIPERCRIVVEGDGPIEEAVDRAESFLMQIKANQHI